MKATLSKIKSQPNLSDNASISTSKNTRLNSSQDEKHDTKMRKVPKALQSSTNNTLFLRLKSPKNNETMDCAKKNEPHLSFSYQQLNISAPQTTKAKLNDEPKDAPHSGLFKSTEPQQEAPSLTNHVPTIGLITSHTRTKTNSTSSEDQKLRPKKITKPTSQSTIAAAVAKKNEIKKI